MTAGDIDMHLVINATEIGRQRGGNETYLLGLLKGMEGLLSPPQTTLILTSTGKAKLQNLSGRFGIADVGAYRRLPFFLWQQTALVRRLRPTWYLSTFFLPPINLCRAAVLVHDLSFRSHPGYFPVSIASYMRLLTSLAVRQAERVIALSEFTRQELLRFHPLAAEKTVVVYPGVERSYHPESGPDDEAILKAHGLSPGYIFAIGNIHPRKNLARLLDAYLHLRRQRADVPKMVWGGASRWGSGELLEQARSAGVILPGFVAQEELPALYRQAIMLVYPSLYEGFGLPPMEAMACGTPVVTSNTASLPEAVGEAALTVDPTDVGQIAEAMARLLRDASLRERLKQMGIERARGFSWERTARCLLSSLGWEMW
jgi:glycosyltransferase involved in cell wall biosynthesis